MASAPEINIVAYKRVPFDDTIPDFRGDYTGATALMEVRPEPGADGTPVLSLSTALASGQGIVITYDDEYVTEHQGETFTGASLVQILINEATLEALDYAASPDEPATYHYDMHITPSGGTKFVAYRGTFTINPGATR
jgi:hypothetical protein